MRAAGVENVAGPRDRGRAPLRLRRLAARSPARPTILLYGHHDVQPEGRPEKWISPPFEPTVRNGRLYGRGTADDKAGVHDPRRRRRLVPQVRRRAAAATCSFVIEGEEEIGSENLGTLPAEVQATCWPPTSSCSPTPRTSTPASRRSPTSCAASARSTSRCRASRSRSTAACGAARCPTRSRSCARSSRASRARTASSTSPASTRRWRRPGKTQLAAHPQAALQRGQVQARGRA